MSTVTALNSANTIIVTSINNIHRSHSIPMLPLAERNIYLLFDNINIIFYIVNVNNNDRKQILYNIPWTQY